MKKCPGDVAAPSAGLAQSAAFAVADFRQRLVVTRRDKRGIVEFMAADDLTFRAEHAV